MAIKKSVKVQEKAVHAKTLKKDKKKDKNATKALAKSLKNTPESCEPKHEIKPVSSIKSKGSKLKSPKELLEEIKSRCILTNDRTIIVTPINKNITFSKLFRLFTGSISIRMSGNVKADSRGRAFIQFLNTNAARESVAKLDGHTIGEIKLKVRLCSDKQSEDADSNNWSKPSNYTLSQFNLRELYVTGLPKNVVYTELTPNFPKSIGLTLVGKKNISLKGKNFGICRVEYATPEDAFEDFSSKHNTMIHGCPIIVNYPTVKKKKQVKTRAILLNETKEFLDNDEVIQLLASECQTKNTCSKSPKVPGEKRQAKLKKRNSISMETPSLKSVSKPDRSKARNSLPIGAKRPLSSDEEETSEITVSAKKKSNNNKKRKSLSVKRK